MLTKSDMQLIEQLFEVELLDVRRLLTDDILIFKDEIVGELQALRNYLKSFCNCHAELVSASAIGKNAF